MVSTFYSNLFVLILIILQPLAGYIFGFLSIPYIVQLAFSEIIFLLIPAIIYIFVTKQNFKEAFSIRTINFKTILLLIVFAIIIQPSMGLLSAISTSLFPNNVSEFVSSLNKLPFMLSLFIIAISPAISEEFAFRGAFSSGYKNVNIKKAAFMNGLMFAFLHLNGQQFLYAFVMGILFCYIVYITQSILSTVLVHFIFNGTQMILARILSSNIDTNTSLVQSSLAITDNQMMYITFIVYGFLTFITIPIVYFIFKLLIKYNKKSNYENIQDDKNSCSTYVLRDEKVFNWPIIPIVIIYILIVLAQLNFL